MFNAGIFRGLDGMKSLRHQASLTIKTTNQWDNIASHHNIINIIAATTSDSMLIKSRHYYSELFICLAMCSWIILNQINMFLIRSAYNYTFIDGFIHRFHIYIKATQTKFQQFINYISKSRLRISFQICWKCF